MNNVHLSVGMSQLTKFTEFFRFIKNYFSTKNSQTNEPGFFKIILA